MALAVLVLALAALADLRLTATTAGITILPAADARAGLAASAAPSDERGVALAPLPPETDLVLVVPAAGLDAAALRAGLRDLGVDSLPGRADDAAVRVPATGDAAALGERIAASGLARAVEPDAVVRAHRAPEEPLYADRQTPYLDIVNAERAWEVETGSPDVLIAVVDSGVSYTHPDLTERIHYNAADIPFNGRDDDDNGCVDDFAGCNFVSLTTADPSCDYTHEPPHWRASDDEGHGSFVTGIAAAAGENEVGIAGVAWDARILPVKVLDCTATGRVADAAAGIRYAARMGADVINVSFGAPNDSVVLREAVEEAQASGAVVVASAGNDGRRGITYPAAYPGVVSVAASGFETANGIDYRTLAPFANFGEVEVMAPGVEVWSTIPDELCGVIWACVDGPYAVAGGSSFATPMVSGTVALLRAQHPHASPALIRALLLGTLQPPIPAPEARAAGLLDIGAALERPVFGVGLPGASRATDGGPSPLGAP
ncbi:MAG: S8 family serine peptidase [Dehalococcoidia bacterium]